MAKEILATGTLQASVCRDTFTSENGEQVDFTYLEVPLDDEIGLTENVKLKSKASYVCIIRKFRSQPTVPTIKINKTT